MSQRTAVVASLQGLHARPAALFTQAVAATGVPVTIAKGDGAPVDAASTLLVMTLGARLGDEVTLACEDEGVLEDLARLIETDLDAPDAGAAAGTAAPAQEATS
ncbi:HPr family phosphocarrier protein [Xylanimonas oleitrophica]|uniref:Phosphocarrier protein HPr n=1 Tax=Xylanimonas oleitrophica TaxID=2607479 RepID=A0A2W5YIK9_9MICO|nr:HPr family phosphocarrier protein [Xylanimonas oleitrophica]PZR54921.1 HPr family phosphocarrier protein [Xylanimonas oleitrophica]